MTHSTIVRAIMESVADQHIRNIREDPKRTIRRMVDLGGQFSRGRFQQQFFRLGQQMLKNEDSPYYGMIQETAAQVASETLKRFCINIGYESWTCGASMIREREREAGYQIPWSVTFHLSGGLEPLPMAEYRRVVEEGKDLGIFTYFFDLGMRGAWLTDLLELADTQPRCAFIIFLAPGVATPEAMRVLASRHNVMISVEAGRPGWREALAGLAEQGCLCALHRTYGSAAEAEEITSGAWPEEVGKQSCSFAFCIGTGSCPEESLRRVTEYVQEQRIHPKHPVFLIDYYADHLRIDQIISDESCFLGVREDGTLTCASGAGEAPTAQRIQDGPLEELLKRHPHLPKG